jgi:putative DNA primase/helicase
MNIRDHMPGGSLFPDDEPADDPFADDYKLGPDDLPIVATTASGVTPKNAQWAWQGWIPLGMLSLLIGLPGRGKTTFAGELAAQLTRGDLPGDLAGHPADVLIISFEDMLEYTLTPRLMAAEADLERVHFLGVRNDARNVDLAEHLGSIEWHAIERSAKLLIVDPLVAGLGGEIDSHRDQSVRSILAPLAALAERQMMAITSTMHFSKSATSALIGAGGSIGFVGAARSILVFGTDPNDEDGASGPKRVLAHAKCNVGKLQKSRELLLREDVLHPFDEEKRIFTSRVVIGEKCDVSADDLVRDGGRELSPKVAAEKFLRQLLADGPHRATEIRDLAEDEDVSWRTLERAKRDLGVDSFQKDKVHWWRLPDEEPEAEPERDDGPEEER